MGFLASGYTSVSYDYFDSLGEEIDSIQGTFNYGDNFIDNWKYVLNYPDTKLNKYHLYDNMLTCVVSTPQYDYIDLDKLRKFGFIMKSGDDVVHKIIFSKLQTNWVKLTHGGEILNYNPFTGEEEPKPIKNTIICTDDVLIELPFLSGFKPVKELKTGDEIFSVIMAEVESHVVKNIVKLSTPLQGMFLETDNNCGGISVGNICFRF